MCVRHVCAVHSFEVNLDHALTIPVQLCVCVVAAVDRGLEVTDSQLQGQQRVPHDLPEETVSERVARLA